MMLDVSVIIPTLNAEHHLPTTLAACTGTRETLVVDGGSPDGTVIPQVATLEPLTVLLEYRHRF